MKITLNIPDGTLCMFVDYVTRDLPYGGLFMQGHSVPSDDLYDGAVIDIPAADEVAKR
jgi:hypothetical protein